MLFCNADLWPELSEAVWLNKKAISWRKLGIYETFIKDFAPKTRKTAMKSEFFAGHLFCYPFMVRMFLTNLNFTLKIRLNPSAFSGYVLSVIKHKNSVSKLNSQTLCNPINSNCSKANPDTYISIISNPVCIFMWFAENRINIALLKVLFIDGILC